jgi:hypothetical protein
MHRWLTLARTKTGRILGNELGGLAFVNEENAALTEQTEHGVWDALLAEGWQVVTTNESIGRFDVAGDVPVEELGQAHGCLGGWQVCLRRVAVDAYALRCGCAAHHKLWVVDAQGAVLLGNSKSQRGG